MKSAVISRHAYFEDLGGLPPILRRRGYDVTYVDLATGAASGQRCLEAWLDGLAQATTA